MLDLSIFWKWSQSISLEFPILHKGSLATLWHILHYINFVGKPQTPCQRRFEKAFSVRSYDKYIPHCTPDGKFFPVQCDASECFCVDQQGAEIKNTTRLLPEFPSCDSSSGKLLIQFLNFCAWLIQEIIEVFHITNCECSSKKQQEIPKTFRPFICWKRFIRLFEHLNR